MNGLKIIAIIAIAGGLAGFGILSNEVILNAQTITVMDSTTDFDNFECDCDQGTDCDELGPNGKALCGISP